MYFSDSSEVNSNSNVVPTNAVYNFEHTKSVIVYLDQEIII